MTENIHGKIGRRIKKSEGNHFGWIRDLKRGEVKFDKPVVLCLAGDGTQDDGTANGMASEVEKTLGRLRVTENDIQILSVQYPKISKESHQFSMERRSFSDKHSIDSEQIQNPEYIKDIYTTLFQPLIMNSKGHRISFNEAQKKFRNLTIISHCHGTFVACKLINYLTEEMKKYGYKDDEIKALSSEIVSIGLSPRSGFHRKDGSLKFGFTMLDDSSASYLYPILTENAGQNCVISSLTLGMEETDGTYMYYSGDNLKYKDVDKDSFLLINPSFMHAFICYVDDSYIDEDPEDNQLREKSAEGVNFSRLIVRTFQNAVSLSKLGIKRTEENLVSNETPITFKQGNKILNKTFINKTFEGNNQKFEQNLIDYRKWAMDQRFKKATNKIEEQESENILVKVLNNSDER
ncbi:MAG: hypothetical protein K6F04_03205 [bacterium]|nr:hypothetical protein [bacterium]